jgi:hypothetical protein
VVELAAARSAVAALKVPSRVRCGADKPWETVTVTTPEGTFDYLDAFYGCVNEAQPHVDGIDAALRALGALVH